MTFAERLADCAGLAARRLERALDDIPAEPVTEAMRYAVVGGKGIRAFLVMEGAALHGVPDEVSVSAAAAVEAMHAYSLVHDDLPCMDDDDLRRGQPTVHRRWDEATAVLAGDALQSLAFELALSHPEPREACDLGTRLARAAGAGGMVLGQARDIAAETGQPLSLDEVTALQAAKTGALIVWSAEAGPLMARADPAPLRRYAAALGLAFQIADDLLDVEGDVSRTGKRVGKDAAAGKATFVSLLGAEGARNHAGRLVAEAETALASYGHRAARLAECARYAIERSR